MKLHELKIKEEYMIDIVCGKKTFELRKNDRDFQVDDIIRFIVVDKNHTETESEQASEQPACYYDEKTLYRITYVLKNVPEYGLDKDYCILGIRELIIKNKRK